MTLVAGNTYTLNGRVQFGNGAARMSSVLHSKMVTL